MPAVSQDHINLRRKHPGLTIDGVTKTYREWGRETGLSETVVWARVKVLGWKGKRILSPARLAHTEEIRSRMSNARKGCGNPAWRGGPDAALDRYLRRYYKLSLEDYRMMVLKQAGVCAICLMPPSKRERRLSVDHCHSTGKIRGLLCKSCNWILSQFKEDPQRFRSAADYLERNNAG